MNKYSIRSLLLLLIFIPGITIIQAQDGSDLLEKMDQVIFAPKDKQAQVKINVSSGKKDDKIREAILMQKGADKKIYRYTIPESQAGVATLSLPGDIMWLYMPAFEKPKKISLLAKSQAFTGTDFAYEDIPVQPYSDRYTPEFLKVEGNTYLLKLVPLDNKSNYSRLIVAIDQQNHYPVRIEYFDKKGGKHKEATYKYVKTGNYWNPEEVTMTDLKKNSQTSIIMTDVKFDQGLPDDLFTVENFMR